MKPGAYRVPGVCIFLTALSALAFYVWKDSSSFKDLPDWIVLIVILVLVFMLSTLPIDIVMFVVGLIYTTKLEHQKALMDYKSNPKKDDEEADKSKE